MLVWAVSVVDKEDWSILEAKIMQKKKKPSNLLYVNMENLITSNRIIRISYLSNQAVSILHYGTTMYLPLEILPRAVCKEDWSNLEAKKIKT